MKLSLIHNFSRRAFLSCATAIGASALMAGARNLRAEPAPETSDVSYDVWRTYDPDTTIRFHVLRLHEAGMIRSTPQQIIARGTDWRFVNRLKTELKA